jgi:ABC-type branched-subunit amino acid transport system ATPase component/branched-subunit amino acid ABC-type transport system permease component
VKIYVMFLLLGLGNGGVFAALAMALVVTFRSSGVLNFATGAQALYAAYSYSLLRQGQLLQPIPGLTRTIGLGSSLGFVPAFAVTLAIQAVLGAVCYVAVFRPLRKHRAVTKAVASIGLLGLLTTIVNYQVGTQVINVNPIFPTTPVTVFGITIAQDRLWLAVTIIGLGIALTLVYRFTRFGLATRAVAESEIGAVVSGLSPDRIALANWVISFVVTGVAGVLISPLVPLVPGTYTLFIVPALAAAVVGRFYALGPAIAAGIGIGMLESLSVYLNGRFPSFPAGVGECIPLVLVLSVLVVNGRPLPSRGTLVQAALGRAPRLRSPFLPACIGTVAVVVGLILFHGNYRASLITSMILAVIALSLVVVTGYLGQISLAQLTLSGVAAFSLSTIGHDWGVPFPIAPIMAALVATFVGVIVGLPAVRVRGLLLGVATLTLAIGVEAIWFQNNSLDGGSGGRPVPTPELFGWNMGIGSGKDFPRISFGILCLIVLVLCSFGVSWLRSSRLGSAMLAVRADERSAAAAGIDVVKTKLVGFAISAFIAGIGGSLLAYQLGTVTFDSFDAYVGLIFFSIVVVAGMTSVSGALVAGLLGSGGILFTWLSNEFKIGNWYGIIAGLGVVLTVIKNPDGLVGPVHAQLEKARLRKIRQRVAQKSVPDAAPPSSPIDHLASVNRGVSSLLDVQDLTVRYGGVVAVDHVSFSVRQGQIVGLIGPNGAGKTTTIDALCGFHPYDGTVHLDGDDMAGDAPHQRASRGLGRTFQLAGVSDDLTVEENTALGQHRAARGDRKPLDDLFELLGLSDLRELHVAELSQGQRQLVSVARALAGEPRLLLLDEPAAGLDSTESEWLCERLRHVRDRGATILLIEHDMSLVLGLCDEIHVLDFGGLIASGSPVEIRNNELVSAAYLGDRSKKVG